MNNNTLICYIGFIKVTTIDQFRCGLMNFAETLYLNNFNYICMFLNALIMLISIFGKTSGNYHWFILHQAFWDFMVSYDSFCNGWGMSLLLKVQQQPKCFYAYNSTPGVYSPLQELSDTVINFIQTAPFAALTLLPASRFLALYYFKLYEKLSQKWRIIFVILIFNFILAIFYSGRFYTSFLNSSKLVKLTEICFPYTPNFNATCFSQISAELSQTNEALLLKIVNSIILFLPTLYLFFTIVFAILIFLRILKQAKFQQKHNKNDFYNTLRIAGVIVLQASIHSFALFIISVPKITTNFAPTFQFPLWLTGSYGLFSSVPRYMISQIRVFLDAFIVLILMTGYREVIVNFLKTMFFALKNPRKTFQKSKSYFRKDTSVTIF